MEEQPLITREEVTAMLFTLADINVHVAKIVRLLENGFDGETEASEDDA